MRHAADIEAALSSTVFKFKECAMSYKNGGGGGISQCHNAFNTFMILYQNVSVTFLVSMQHVGWGCRLDMPGNAFRD